jgi:hypothetical protein
MFAALRKAGVASELHIYQTGGHGHGMGPEGSRLAEWPAQFLAWARANALIGKSVN